MRVAAGLVAVAILVGIPAAIVYSMVTWDAPAPAPSAPYVYDPSTDPCAVWPETYASVMECDARGEQMDQAEDEFDPGDYEYPLPP